ncbi:hypothetical protein WJ98_19465 [Burkholderia ubonensis]|nr:hypothetical protein WJ98_19465 [Burkholderia ubonensis]
MSAIGHHLVRALLDRRYSVSACIASAGVLVTVPLLKRVAPNWPAVLIAVVAATLATHLLPLHGIATVGALSAGIPAPQVPAVSIAVVSFADISMLSRALAARAGDAPERNQELVALGAANLLAGLTQGCAVSSSASRVPVAMAAGAFGERPILRN